MSGRMYPSKSPLKDPKVTVLMGTYNRPGYLREAIKSVIAQRMEDWELLVMNDGGVDVGHIVEGFGDNRIRYFHDNVNLGLAARLNFGLKEARGEYISYLGDDDLFYPNHLEILSRALDEDPEIGAVYSDLYAVQVVTDESTGRRYPLHKFIQVSRDFNRDFMFYFNHTLHVSLLHRKDLALRARGYDEDVRVLIDWNITRKLCFYTDFRYIPAVTGEYYMPIANSDRISVLGRQDNEKYKHNLRKIKADLPPEPWPKVDRIGVIFPVSIWDDFVVETLTGLVDHLCYPVRYIIVNNNTGLDCSECRMRLGKIGELKNVFIHNTSNRLSEIEAYRFGAEKADVDYVYLPSKRVNTKLPLRIIAARQYLKKMNADGLKWDVEEEKKGPFDFIIERERFLKLVDPVGGQVDISVDIVPKGFPESLRCDVLIHFAKSQYDSGNYKLAYQFVKEVETGREGAVGDQAIIHIYSKICFALKNYVEAEQRCREMIDRGYGADIWIRLGRILQIRRKFDEAIEAYRKGLEEIGLNELDLDSTIFPIVSLVDTGAFTAFIGMGECMLEKVSLNEAAKMFHMASKLKANSYRPYLGFGRLFLMSGELKRAEESLMTALKTNGNAPEVYRALGELFERRGRIERAYEYYNKAFEKDKIDFKNVEPIFKTGSSLHRWEDVKVVLKEFLEHRPGHVMAMRYMSTICHRLGAYKEAEELLDRCVVLDKANCEIKDNRLMLQ